MNVPGRVVLHRLPGLLACRSWAGGVVICVVFSTVDQTTGSPLVADIMLFLNGGESVFLQLLVAAQGLC